MEAKSFAELLFRRTLLLFLLGSFSRAETEGKKESHWNLKFQFETMKDKRFFFPATLRPVVPI